MSDKNIQDIYRNELMWGKPIVYKGATIYPVEMSEAFNFHMAVTALTYDQMQYPDKEIAFKPRLNFLIEMGLRSHQSKDESSIEYQLWGCFSYLLALVFKDQVVGFSDPDSPNRKVITITRLGDKTVIFGSKDFDEIRRIVLISNDIEVDDEFIHADIKERMERDAKIMRKSKFDPPNLEDLIDICFMYTGKDYDFIKTMNYRKFNRLIKRISIFEDYKICKTGSMSGMVQFKEEIQHWLTSMDKKDKYQGLVQSKQDLLDKYNKI